MIAFHTFRDTRPSTLAVCRFRAYAQSSTLALALAAVMALMAAVMVVVVVTFCRPDSRLCRAVCAHARARSREIISIFVQVTYPPARPPVHPVRARLRI